MGDGAGVVIGGEYLRYLLPKLWSIMSTNMDMDKAAGNSSQEAHDELMAAAARKDHAAMRAHSQKTTPEQDYAVMRTALQQLLADMTRYMQDMHQTSERYSEATTQFQEAHDERSTKSTELEQKMYQATQNLHSNDPSVEEICDAATKAKEVSLEIIKDLYRPFAKHSETFFTQSIVFQKTYDRMGPLLQAWHDNMGKYAHCIDSYIKYHDKKLQDQVDFGIEQLEELDTQNKKEMHVLTSKFEKLKSMYALLINTDPKNKKIDALKDENNNRKTTIVKMGINYMKMHHDLQDAIKHIQNPEVKALLERKAKSYAAQIAKFPSKWLEENADLKQLSDTRSDQDLEQLDQAFENLSMQAPEDDDLKAGSKEIHE